jgi:hypothetical protein
MIAALVFHEGDWSMRISLGMAAAAVAGALVAGLGMGSAAHAADLIPYPNSGLYNATTYSFTAAADGDVIGYIVGGFAAGFTNEVGMLDNGVLTGAGFGLNNHASSQGDSFNFGTVSAGDVLTFVMHNLSLGAYAYSNPAMNLAYDDPDYTGGHNHIYSTSYTATSPNFAGVPAGRYVAFEDIPFPGADFNYDDESFVFTNTAAHDGVPEPGAWIMMILGFAGAGTALRRSMALARLAA